MVLSWDLGSIEVQPKIEEERIPFSYAGTLAMAGG
jgi:hypothetical protein